MELSSNVLCPFLVWGLRSGDETVIGNERLHLLESSETSIAACFSFCRLEIMKLKSVSYFTCTGKAYTIRWCVWSLYFYWPISDFWQSAILSGFDSYRPWKGLHFSSKFDLQRTTTKSTIIAYTSLDSSSLDCQDFSANSPSPPSRKHRIKQFCFDRLYSITVTCRCPVDWKFVIYNLCMLLLTVWMTIYETCRRVFKICNPRRRMCARPQLA